MHNDQQHTLHICLHICTVRGGAGTDTCTSPFGPMKISGSAARLQKATSPVRAVRRDKVKSMSVTVTPPVAASIV